MANAAQSTIKGYLKGREATLLEEERDKRNAREEAITAKQKRITAYRGSIDPSKPVGGQAGYLGLAREDPAAAKATADAYGPAFEQHQKQLGNAWRTTRAMPVAQRGEQSQRLIAAAVNMGVTDEATADQLSTMAQNDPDAFSGVMDQLFGTADKGRKETERDRKIQDLRARGFSREESVDIADGRIRVQQDPLSGKTFRVNVATGARLDVEGEEAPETAGPGPARTPEKTVFDQLGEGVGIGAVFSEGLSRTAGQFAPSLAKEETTRARTAIRGLREKLLQALAVSGRPPVVEQTRLLENIPSTGVFESEGHARAQLTELHGQLSRQLMDDYAFGNDTSNPKKLREKALEQAHHIQNMLREMGDPGGPGGGPGGIPQGAIDRLKGDPSLSEDFDAMFGLGAAQGVLGG